MNRQRQILDNLDWFPPFSGQIQDSLGTELRARSLDILQINVGYTCNLSCKHCHVDAGPHRTESMSREVFEHCLKLVHDHNIPCVDITGGAPEMNDHFEWFIRTLSAAGRRVIVRSNLSILATPKYKHLIALYAKLKIEVVASVPDPTAHKTDAQRGDGVFKKIVEVIKALNQQGYAVPNSNLQLNLVHNPVGAFLPAAQSNLEFEYRRQLRDNYNIEFNHLFCITNIPVGRYLDYLERTENLEDYVDLLVQAYNPAAAENVMCRDTLSVSWDGSLYDCDFNQMLDQPLQEGAPRNIVDSKGYDFASRKIELHNACYACTAGAGSSCQGEVA